MEVIDGARGGGQILRLAVALGSLAGTPVKIKRVRGSRDDPGLAHQHVAAIEAIAELAKAKTDGVSLGSETVTFEPGRSIGGETEVEIETAGSITLLFDTVLPLALDSDSTIKLKGGGGTDVKWAPTIDYYRTGELPHPTRSPLTPFAP